MIIHLIISLVFVCLASFCNAVMDVCEFKYKQSIFNVDRKFKIFGTYFAPFFDPDCRAILRLKRFNFLGFEIKQPLQLCDGWHFAKMLMCFFLILAVMSHAYHKYFWDTWSVTLLCEFIFYGLAWNLTFNFCYNHLFIKE